jgi:gluconolactonase
MANGMTLAPDGRLLVCEQGTPRTAARISAVDRMTADVETIVETFAGLPLNSPNDVVVKRDGTIWFTDPSYGYLQGFRPEPQWRDTVYRYDPAHDDLVIVADHLDKPNGLVFSPDETVLYVGDSGANRQPGTFHPGRTHHVYAYDVLGGRSMSRESVVDVTEPGIPDGLTVDITGRLYVSCAEGVRVLTPDGRLLGRIRLPGAVNLTFGGPEGNHLYITADTAVWVAVLDTKAA